MAKIKVIVEATEKYFETRYYGIIEVDGVIVPYRYIENSNGTILYVNDKERGWTTSPFDIEMYNMLLNLFTEMMPEDLGKEGNIIDFI